MKTKYRKTYNGKSIEYRMFFSGTFSKWCVTSHTYDSGWGYKAMGTKAEMKTFWGGL